MADVLTIRVLDKNFTTLLKRIRTLPAMASNAMMEWGKGLENSLKESARQADIKPFTGSLYNKGIEWRQAPKGTTGRLFMRMHGVFLNSMKTHWVSIKPSRTTLVAWGQQAQKAGIMRGATLVAKGKINRYSIQVHKHPFIDLGFKRQRAKLRPTLQRFTRIALA